MTDGEKIDLVLSQIQHMNDKFDKKFDEIDKRFDKVDKKFNEIENRLDNVENKLGEVENRLSKVEILQEKMRENILILAEVQGNHIEQTAKNDDKIIKDVAELLSIHTQAITKIAEKEVEAENKIVSLEEFRSKFQKLFQEN